VLIKHKGKLGENRGQMLEVGG